MKEDFVLAPSGGGKLFSAADVTYPVVYVELSFMKVVQLNNGFPVKNDLKLEISFASRGRSIA